MWVGYLTPSAFFWYGLHYVIYEYVIEDICWFW